MAIEVLYNDDKITIKAVYLNDKLHHIDTCILCDNDAYKLITIYKDGNFDICENVLRGGIENYKQIFESEKRG